MGTGARTVMTTVTPRTIMITATNTAMTTTTDILTLSQWLSPAFPVGAFAYSHGIETAVQTGAIGTAQELQDWLQDLVDMGSARADAVFLCLSHAAQVSDLPALDQSARAFAASSGRLMETDLQGAAFVDTLGAVSAISLPRLTYPVAVGAAAAQAGLESTLTCAMYLQAMVSTLTAAAMRLVPLGQVDGQKVQLALKPLCEHIAHSLRHATTDDLYSNTFASDIAAMRHETQYSRVFRT